MDGSGPHGAVRGSGRRIRGAVAPIRSDGVTPGDGGSAPGHADHDGTPVAPAPTDEHYDVPTTMDKRVAGNGRMILPLPVRRAMGLQGGAKVVLRPKSADETTNSSPSTPR